VRGVGVYVDDLVVCKAFVVHDGEERDVLTATGRWRRSATATSARQLSLKKKKNIGFILLLPAYRGTVCKWYSREQPGMCKINIKWKNHPWSERKEE
jgi:hypothetical protein